MTNSEFNPGFLGMTVLLARYKQNNTGANMAPAQACKVPLRRLQIGGGGFAAAPVGLDIERQLLALDQRAHAGALDGGNVDEDVGAAVVLDDEAVALLGVEKLDGTLSHDGPPVGKRRMRFKNPGEPFARPSIRILRGLEEGQGRLNREWRVYRS